MIKKMPRGYKNAELLHNRLKSINEKSIIESGKRRAISQFHQMAEEVPAYRKFLDSHKQNTDSAAGFKFTMVPSVSKDNYLRAYPRTELCWDGKFAENSWVISTTSGSTGNPYYFPRTDLQDEFLTITTELYLRNNFSIHKKTTLYIDAFPMGAWIGGVFTYESVKQVAEKGYSISIITPGIHKQEVINAVKELGNDFDQIIIGAYAPFLKDILDDGERQGIIWSNHSVGFVFSAEAFSEAFRDYVAKKTNTKDILRGSLNHYGTVDMGTMAHETPLSILIRRTLVQDDRLRVLFPEHNRQPTFAQYNPELFYFEQVDSNLLCTSFSGLPLVRYDLKDYGGVLTMKEVFSKMEGAGYDMQELIKAASIKDTIWNLPFIYVYERNDFSVSYYAFLIYPDTIRRALQIDDLQELVTGKFSMLVSYTKEGRQELQIHIEKKLKIADQQLIKLEDIVHEKLLDESSEYRETISVIGDIVKPLVILHEYEDAEYFKPGTKQKWVIK